MILYSGYSYLKEDHCYHIFLIHVYMWLKYRKIEKKLVGFIDAFKNLI